MIWEELNPSLIFIDLEASNSDEVFEQVGGAFTKAGYTKDSYVEALKERESEFPTGLDVDGFGVAIPHTSVAHVNKAGTAIAVLKNPVTFHVMGGDDDETVEIKLVFMLAVVDPNKHIDELQQILAIIQDTAVLDKLKQAENADDIINTIKDKESTL